MDRSDFVKLTQLRLQEARVLLENGKHEGAYYLCVYAVECALKACIAKQTQRHEFPDKKIVNDSYTHDLTKLVNVGGLAPDLDRKEQSDAVFRLNWSVVRNWTEQSRYEHHSSKEARDLYKAITSRNHGVLRWIRQHW